ncbi:MAG: glycosyltransferase family 4 protein [bacterium]|nr:glycosyltransferase family 4 protein [bacterium]
MTPRRVAVVSFTNLDLDSRVNRQIRFLSQLHETTAIGLSHPNVERTEFKPLHELQRTVGTRLFGALKLLAHRYISYYWALPEVVEAAQVLRETEADLIIANDLETLPVVLANCGNARVLFDAHEYSPEEFEARLKFRLLHRPFRIWQCRRYIPKVDAMITVSEGIADIYHREVGVKATVVWNATDFESLAPQPVDRSRIRLVHHGGAIRQRRLERMISMMELLDDRFELDLILRPSDPDYYRELQQLAEHNPRIHFPSTVAMLEVPAMLNQYDLGVYVIQESTINGRFALPNKFFEFVQGRVALAIGPSPEMAKLAKKHKLGLITDDFCFESMARSLNQLDSATIERYKRNVHTAAPILSADTSMKNFIEVVDSLLN